MLVRQRQSVPKERRNVPVFPSPKLIGIEQLQNPDLNGQKRHGKTRHSVRNQVALANLKQQQVQGAGWHSKNYLPAA